jgi:hypothetical protein
MKLFDLSTLLLIANKTRLNLRFIRSPSGCTFYSKVHHLPKKFRNFSKTYQHTNSVFYHTSPVTVPPQTSLLPPRSYCSCLTAWNRVLAEKLTGPQLVEIFPAFCGTRTFTTAFTSARQLSLSWTRPFQSMPSHRTSWRSIFTLFFYLLLGLPSDSFPQVSPPNTFMHPSCLLYVSHGLAFTFFLIWPPE